MADIKAIAEALVKLTVGEVNELSVALKNEYGVEPAAVQIKVAVHRPKAPKAPKPYSPRKIENKKFSSKKFRR